MPAFPPVNEQLALLTRGVVDLHVRAELEERLTQSRETGKPLRVKAGFDPTRPDLHLGHTVLLSKMRQFQDLGHTAIFLIGDSTAMVGDPTGANDARPRLTREQVNAAAETYLAQAFKVLDGSKVELRRNSEWLDALKMTDVVELMAKATVSRMLERNEFALRFAEHRPIHQHEFLYPLLQGYDSVALASDIELGGTDQLFNLLLGRDLMPKYGMRAQMVMTTPILEGTDAKIEGGKIVGKKMSKSADNYIGIQEEPTTMFRKAMQVGDDVIFRYFELLSSRTNEEIEALKREKAAGRNPMEIKGTFAREIIERFHGREAAEHAAREFERVYTHDEKPEQIKEVVVEITTPSAPAGVVVGRAFGITTNAANTAIAQSNVHMDSVTITNWRQPLDVDTQHEFRLGSKHRQWRRVIIKLKK
jgi:tyrosyl-tRNA synthetase